MSQDTCILTTNDFLILEVLLGRSVASDSSMTSLLRRKINAAQVVFGGDVPADVATLNSRVLFGVDGRDPDTRIICQDRMTSPIGLFLSVATFRGLSLLGLSEGQEFRLHGHDGVEETIRLERVLYQPETARREREVLDQYAVTKQSKPAFRLIRGAFYGTPKTSGAIRHGLDDPDGPSAA
ncbi:nucleoside-diphosphate kinase [Pararhizobium sp.]|uniref:nucleoside-diphosphate kinase n=1 Tax=Pararhizobium sp. TaxID=1977563 RepID=UPI003D10A75F